MDVFHPCPVCQARGNTTFLCLRQINLNTAVYLCPDGTCSYPQGYSWIYVSKNLSNDDQSDSDLSDSVNDDIQRMTNSIKIDCKLKQTETINHNIIGVFKPNEDKFKKIKYQENINLTLSTETEGLLETLNLSCNTSPTFIQQKISASGALDSEIVDLSLSKVGTHECVSKKTYSEDKGKIVEKKYKLPGRSKNKPLSEYFKLPSVEDIDTDFSLRIEKTDFENGLKLKICTRKKQKEFCFPKSIVQEALETAKEDGNKKRSKKNQSLVNLLLGENKRKTSYTDKDLRTFYKSFKTASSIQNKMKKKTKHTHMLPIIDRHIKGKLEESKCNTKLTNTKSIKKHMGVENNTFVSCESTNNNSNLGDEVLNEFFENIDEHEHVNNPNSNENITDFEELFTSLCD